MLSRLTIVVRVALAFLTRVPGAHPDGADRDAFVLAQPIFPVVGLLIGLIVASLQIGAETLGLPPLAAVGIALAGGLLLTGALHEDGLADVADGFGGGYTRQSKLDIMRDSRVGTYGAVALTATMIIKAGAMVELRGAALVAGLAVAHAGSRSAATAVAGILPAARANGLGASAGRPAWWVVTTSMLISAGSGLLVLPPGRFLAATTVAITLTAAMASISRRQIGGYTGDVLGATQQIVETGILLALVARPGLS